MGSILIVDDDTFHRETVSILLREQGHAADAVASGAEALERLSQEIFDVVLTDLRMGDLDGLQLLRRIRENHAHVEVILLTAHGTVETAVEAMKQGAAEYLTKPFNPEELLVKVRKAVERQALLKETRDLRRELRDRDSLRNLIGSSRVMRDLADLILRVAPTDSTVLIEGESGTGKGLVARAIHGQSERADQTFVSVNCGAVPEPLLESELFGHVRGAFTGAVQTKKGLFEEASQGTLFLDEVSAMPLATQVKILNALQDREIRRVGGTTAIPIRARVIAASNRNLKKLVAEGSFRDDLYYRLSVIPVTIPPLRQRIEDVPVLADHFMKTLSRKTGQEAGGIAPAAMTFLMQYAWPGNVRELENVIERALVLARGARITPADLPADLAGDVPSDVRSLIGARVPLVEVEKAHILATLQSMKGDRTQTARLLGIGRNTLWRKLQRYGVGAPGKGAGRPARPPAHPTARSTARSTSRRGSSSGR